MSDGFQYVFPITRLGGRIGCYYWQIGTAYQPGGRDGSRIWIYDCKRRFGPRLAKETKRGTVATWQNIWHVLPTWTHYRHRSGPVKLINQVSRFFIFWQPLSGPFFRSWIDDDLMQDSNTKYLIFNIPVSTRIFEEHLPIFCQISKYG